MFQFKYFILFVLLGFALGFTKPMSETTFDRRPVDGLSPLFNIIAFGAMIWSFLTFGFFWGLLSFGEMFLGYQAGLYARRNS